MNQASVGDPRAGKRQPAQMRYVADPRQSRVGDGRGAEIEPVELPEPLELGQIGVRRWRALQRQSIGPVERPHPPVADDVPEPFGSPRLDLDRSPQALELSHSRRATSDRQAHAETRTGDDQHENRDHAPAGSRQLQAAMRFTLGGARRQALHSVTIPRGEGEFMQRAVPHDLESSAKWGPQKDRTRVCRM